MWWIFPIGIAIYEVLQTQKQKNQRQILYRQAETYARSVGKPLLVVGTPKGLHPCGDLLIDLKPSGECPIEISANITNLDRFNDKEFGSAFVSHVLEHVEDIDMAFKELNRVAEKVLIAYPDAKSLGAWLYPGHKYLIYSAPPETDYIIYKQIRKNGF